MTIHRAQDEIVARIAAVANDDWMGNRQDVLLRALDFGNARPYLKDGVTEEQWNTGGKYADIDADAREYYHFALGKMRDHRGLSAVRSVEKLTEFAWLLGRDDVVAAMKDADYANYGAPKVHAFATGFGLAWPDEAELNRMAEGLPCIPNCDEGCGS